MLYYAAMFLFVGFIAGALNMAGVATIATQSSWTLLLSGIALLMIHLWMERAGQVSRPISFATGTHREGDNS